MSAIKPRLGDLALLGGTPLFPRPRSTSNLVRPDFETFMRYSETMLAARQYTNNGPLVRELENRLATFHHTRNCVSFCNGFWALVLAMRELALPGRDEVVMPSLTYRRLADVASWAGLVPRFCEVESDTLAVSPRTLTPELGARTALIVAVHPVVNCCDALALSDFAAERGLPILFDSVESVYETCGGRKTGGFGKAEVFSLHASKLINGFEGGYLTTDDADLADRLMLARGFGFAGQDRVVMRGTNAKLNEMHAAMALASLDDLEDQVGRNRARYDAYRDGLARLPELRLLAFDEAERSSYKNVVVETTDAWPLPRDLTIRLLNAEGILARAYYDPPLHLKPTAYPTLTRALPVTEALARRFVSMPCGHHVSGADIERIVDLLAFLRAHAEAVAARCAP